MTEVISEVPQNQTNDQQQQQTSQKTQTAI